MKKSSSSKATPVKGQQGLFAFGFSSTKKNNEEEKPIVIEEEEKIQTTTTTPVSVVRKTSNTPKEPQAVCAVPLQTPTAVSKASKPVVAPTDDVTPKKRKIVMDDDSESEIEAPPKKLNFTQKKRAKPESNSEASSGEEEEDDDDMVDDDKEAPTKRRASPTKKSKPAVATTEVKAGVLAPGEHEHNLLSWLQDNRKDAKMREWKKDKDYDPSTLFVPPGYLAGQPAFHARNPRKITDAIRVWWDFYSKNADCVLFYKVGKFYELYHACADVGVKHCDLLYMKGDVAHCGFPESAWAKNMSKLVSLNYRVCRIEQTESVAECALRTGKKSSMVRREICQVLSPGTMTYQIRDEFAGYDTHGRNGLLAIGESNGHVGICLLDASTGKFQLGAFALDEHMVALRSLLAFETPAELVYCPNNLSESTLQVLRNETKLLHSPVFQSTAVETYFPSSDMPSLLRDLSVCESQALGYCLTVLKRALIDEELVTMRRFTKYIVPTNAASEQENTFMRLDNQALFHLEILCNNQDGTRAGSLLDYLDRTKSKFGARMLREWVCRPLANKRQLLQRQNQVTELLSVLNTSEVTEFRKALAQSPDLERQLSRIHSLGMKKKSTHPDSRAVIYCAAEVNKSKIEAFCLTLASLRQLRVAGGKLAPLLERCALFTEISSQLQSSIVTEALDHFDTAFDAKQAKKLGAIEPRRGVAPEFDSAQVNVDMAKEALQAYLKEAKRESQCDSVTFFMPSTGKNRYQLEVPETKPVPRDWQLASKRKGYKRYMTPKLKALVLELEQCEEALSACSQDVTRLVFAEFDKKRPEWAQLVSACSRLDCLLALAIASSSSTATCLPEFIDGDDGVMEIKAGVHPCVAAALERTGKQSFIPNDLQLNSSKGKLMLLTGPNMGGKSTLLRQTCLLAIVAQIGCRVTADEYRATIVDAIFTRIGASDRILQGQSTFFVELSETATILHNATKNSLVILDELGRGTSSFDGTAIAHSVVEKLVEIGSLTMFATHYHSLVRECSAEMRGQVSLAHMECDATGNEATDSVLFLYKLAEGCSDRSYGLNVARLAKLPEHVIQRAKQRSMEFECEFDAHMQARLLEEIKLACEQNDGGRVRTLLRRAQGLLVTS